jgi:3-deoxy-D-manno-octulosonate 8-phosphate phosphatase (KDO 8-P phosphatase)
VNARKLPIGQRLQAIRHLLLDVDGVLTDGSVNYTDPLGELRRFHVRDGMAIKKWNDRGNETIILSGRASESLVRRAKELGVKHVHQGVSLKGVWLAELQQSLNIAPETILAIGDDLAEMELFRAVGVGVAVADAACELRYTADYVTRAPGGQGAVREVIEWVMQAQGTWA